MKRKLPIIPTESLEKRILTLRGEKVILDLDLAEVYGVTTKALNQAVKRNAERFPADFAFFLDDQEKNEVVTNCDHLLRLKFSPVLPRAFTEHGAIMAANVLNSHSSGEIWALRNSGMSVTENTLLLKNTKTGFSAFGVDPSNGDILVAQCVGTSFLQRLIYTNKVSNLVITQVVQSASSVFISGTGGPSNQSFYLLSSTNIQPPAIWSSTSTGLFDAPEHSQLPIPSNPPAAKAFFGFKYPEAGGKMFSRYRNYLVAFRR